MEAILLFFYISIQHAYCCQFAELLGGISPELREQQAQYKELHKNQRRRLQDDDSDTTDSTWSRLDGFGNNELNPEFGATHDHMIRISDSDYGVNFASAGENRPSARVCSNGLMAAGDADDEPIFIDGTRTAIFVAFGQFIDHEIVENEFLDGEEDNIEIPDDDPHFAHLDEMVFHRSIREDPDVDEIENVVTAFIDGSAIYGSEETDENPLRSYKDGLLMLSDDYMLPLDVNGMLFSGDVRALENFLLTSMHTIWHREHNRVAMFVKSQLPFGSDDETIFQEARKIVRAELQAVLYNEWLPLVLGPNSLSPYRGYDNTVNPQISLEFSTTAYRAFHSMIGAVYQGPEGFDIPLRDAFWPNDELLEFGSVGIDQILGGMADHEAQRLDLDFVGDLRGNGGVNPDPFEGSYAEPFDLASRNIQRARELGVGSFNDVREALGLERYTDFQDISSGIKSDGSTEADALAFVYDDIDDMDLYSGGIAEDEVSGGIVGETFRAIIAEQFERIRDGDRFWYQNDGVLNTDLITLEEIEAVTMYDILSKNSNIEEIQYLQAQVFILPDEQVEVRSGTNAGWTFIFLLVLGLILMVLICADVGFMVYYRVDQKPVKRKQKKQQHEGFIQQLEVADAIKNILAVVKHRSPPIPIQPPSPPTIQSSAISSLFLPSPSSEFRKKKLSKPFGKKRHWQAPDSPVRLPTLPQEPAPRRNIRL